MDNLGAPWSAPLVRDGVVAYPLPAEAPVPWVALDDVADRIVAAVTGDEQGRLPICGPQPLTGEQTAAALARALARPVRWETVGAAEYTARLLRPHTGDEVADGVAGCTPRWRRARARPLRPRARARRADRPRVVGARPGVEPAAIAA